MNGRESLDWKDLGRQTKGANEPHPRDMGFPLPMGAGGRGPLPADPDDAERYLSDLSPARPPASIPEREPSPQPATGFQRAMGMLQRALPLVQQVLPMLSGSPSSPPNRLALPDPSSSRVDLGPIEEGLARLHSDYRALRDQVAELDTTLKRFEDELGIVHDATEQNSQAREEIQDELKAVRRKVSIVTWVFLVLLTASPTANGALFFVFRRFLH